MKTEGQIESRYMQIDFMKEEDTIDVDEMDYYNGFQDAWNGF